MSTIKVNTLDTRSGTTITVTAGKTLAGTDIIGATQIAANAVTTAKILDDNVTYGKLQDTVTANRVLGAVAAGTIGEVEVATDMVADNAVTLAKMADGTQGDTLYYGASGAPTLLPKPGTPADEVFTFATGATAPSWAAAAAGGNTHASQWRLTTDVASGGQDPINANLEVADQDGYGSLGAAMTESSGVFTFPVTGFWHIIYNWTFKPSNYSNDCSCWIDATIDNGSNWVEQSRTYTTGAAAYEIAKMSASATSIVDVTNTSNVKVQFGWSINLNGGTRITYGDSTKMETGFTFLRLADT